MPRRFRFPLLILLSVVSLVSLVADASAQTPELNWPSKQFIHPADVSLTYPCGGGEACDLSDFMRAAACVCAGDPEGRAARDAPDLGARRRRSVQGRSGARPLRGVVDREVGRLAALRLRLPGRGLRAAGRSRRAGGGYPHGRRGAGPRSARDAARPLAHGKRHGLVGGRGRQCAQDPGRPERRAGRASSAS